MRAYLSIGFTIVVILASPDLLDATIVSPGFSAELVIIDTHGNTTKGTLNVADGKVRMETPEVTTGFFLFTGDHAYFVRPRQRTFMDAKQSSALAQIFIPVDTETPCERWQAMANLSGAADNGGEWRCDRVADKTVSGRGTVLFKAVSPRRNGYSIWIDKQFNFPLRLEAEDGSSYQLERIEEKPQPPDLFAVPPNYAKFDPRKLIERLQHSDVLIEPPQ